MSCIPFGFFADVDADIVTTIERLALQTIEISDRREDLQKRAALICGPTRQNAYAERLRREIILAEQAAQVLLEPAIGGIPRASQQPSPAAGPFDDPYAQSLLRVMRDVEESEPRAEIPAAEVGRLLACRPTPNGGTRLHRAGGDHWFGGTGKAIVALHRAVDRARTNLNARVLLTTFPTNSGSCAPNHLN
jgi:hypothetical protein